MRKALGLLVAWCSVAAAAPVASLRSIEKRGTAQTAEETYTTRCANGAPSAAKP